MKIVMLLISFIPLSLHAYQVISGYSIFNSTNQLIKVTFIYCSENNGYGPSRLSQCDNNPSEIEIEPQNLKIIPFNNISNRNDYTRNGILVTSIKTPYQNVSFANDKQAQDMTIHRIDQGDIMQCFSFNSDAVQHAIFIEDIIENKLTCIRKDING